MTLRNSILISLVLGCSGKIAPEPTTTIAAVFGGMEVWVDANEGIVVERGDTELAWIAPERMQFRSADASYEAQLGAFLIEESNETEWVAGAHLTNLASADDRVVFDVVDSSDTLLATGQVIAESNEHISISFDANDNRIRVGLDCTESDHFVGLGSHAMDVDHKGKDVFLFVSEPGVGKSESNLYPPDWMITGQRSAASIPIPGWVTSRGTAWRIETDLHTNLDVCKTDAQIFDIEVWESNLELHLFDGPSPLEARARMTEHTGRPPMPPPWAFAPWNDAIFGTDSVLEFAEFLRTNEIPSSAIWSEDWRGGQWRSYGYRIDVNWNVDETLYPGFTEMNDTLETMGFSSQVYFNPNVNTASDIYEEAEREGYLIHNEDGTPHLTAGAAAGLSQISFLDLTNPEAREFAKSHMHRVIGQGADGWMADYAEWTPIDGIELFDGSDPAATHNRFPQLWQELNAEVAEEASLTGQMGIYYRSGHRSAPRTAGLVWAGDQRTSFQPDDGLPTVIPMGLGLAAAGVPFYGHDIAGYQFIGNNPGTKELFFRWTSLGALSPLMRTHHGIKVDENWDLRDDAETTAHWKRYAELHVQLYPYLRGLAAAAVNDGAPLWIPMGLVHPEDETAWPITDQYYFGPALIVAPVVTESDSEDGSVTRSVYLPEGRFSPFMETGDSETGPTHINVDVPLTEIPIYIKGGGIVPMTTEPAQTLRVADGMRDLSSTEGDRIVYVGLGSDGTFEEEDGASYALSGSGISPQTVEITGNGTVTGEDWALTLSGHPSDRHFTIIAQ
jgi:sulfoquinovosidase